MTFEGAMINRLADVASHSLELNVNTVTFGLVMNEARYGALAPDLQAVVADVLEPGPASDWQPDWPMRWTRAGVTCGTAASGSFN